jgi:hypothetical protein
LDQKKEVVQKKPEQGTKSQFDPKAVQAYLEKRRQETAREQQELLEKRRLKEDAPRPPPKEEKKSSASKQSTSNIAKQTNSIPKKDTSDAKPQAKISSNSVQKNGTTKPASASTLNSKNSKSAPSLQAKDVSKSANLSQNKPSISKTNPPPPKPVLSYEAMLKMADSVRDKSKSSTLPTKPSNATTSASSLTSATKAPTEPALKNNRPSTSNSTSASTSKQPVKPSTSNPSTTTSSSANSAFSKLTPEQIMKLKQRQGLLRDPVYDKTVSKPTSSSSSIPRTGNKQSSNSSNQRVAEKKPAIVPSSKLPASNPISKENPPVKKLSAWDQIMATMKGNDKSTKKCKLF